VNVGGFLFDYGGTLDGEGWHWFDRFVHLYREADLDIPAEEIKRAFYFADDAIAEEAERGAYLIRPLIERHVALQIEVLGDRVRLRSDVLVRGFLELNSEGWARSRAALRRLRPHARLGVVSNFYGNLDALLAEAGLAPLLDVVIESVRVGVAKPDPAIYRISAERMGLAPEAIAMVGDNFDRDLRPARATGMRGIWLRRGDHPPPEPGIADLVISSLAEIPTPVMRGGGDRPS
jgi:putative hydrolase of the HAD superfamily